MLEVLSQRELLAFPALFPLSTTKDPLERFLVVLRWFLALVRTETMEKKPYNPVIGEYHHAWIINDSDPEDVVEFVSEQVSHHPPVSASFTRARKHGITLKLNPTFGVKLGSNQAGVTTAGAGKITTPVDSYELSKAVPDMVVHNVIKGKRYISWSGELIITCPESGYTATLVTKDKNRVNQLSGDICHFDDLDKKVYEFEGICGEKSYIFKSGDEANKKLLFDTDVVKWPSIYYLPVLIH